MAIVCDACKGTENVLQVIVGWMDSPVQCFHEYGQMDLCVTCRLACLNAKTAERPSRELPGLDDGGGGDRKAVDGQVSDARGAG